MYISIFYAHRMWWILFFSFYCNMPMRSQIQNKKIRIEKKKQKKVKQEKNIRNFCIAKCAINKQCTEKEIENGRKFLHFIRKFSSHSHTHTLGVYICVYAYIHIKMSITSWNDGNNRKKIRCLLLYVIIFHFFLLGVRACVR